MKIHALSAVLILTACIAAALVAQERSSIEKLARIYNHWDAAYDIDYEAGFCFLACGRSGLQIVDVSDPNEPFVAGYWDENQGNAYGLDVDGDWAYIADDLFGMSIVNISDPENPVLTSAINTPGKAWDITVSGDLAYIADGESGVRIIDVNDRRNPREISVFDTRGDAKEIVLSGDYAYVADDLNNLVILDISNPNQPRQISFIRNLSESKGLDAINDIIYLADGSGGLRIFDATEPVHPHQIGHHPDAGYVWGVTVVGDFAYLACGVNRGLVICDISDPENIDETGLYNTPGYARAVSVSEDIAFVADYWRGLRVVDIDDPENPREIGFYQTDGYAQGLDIEDGRVYVADDSLGGVRILDVGDDRLEEIGSIDTPGDANKIKVIDRIAYVADGGYGFGVYDLRDPEDPDELYYRRLNGFANDVEIDNNLAYITITDERFINGVYIFDIRNPRRVDYLGFLNIHGGNCHGLKIHRGYAYIAVYQLGLMIIDIRNLENPVNIGRFDIHGAYDIDFETQGQQPPRVLCMAVEERGLCLINVSDPREPELMSFIPARADIKRVKVSGDHAYVTSDWAGIHAINIANPRRPVDVGFYDTPGVANDIVVDDDLIYVADYTNLSVYRFTPVPEIAVNPIAIRFNAIQAGERASENLYIRNNGTGELLIQEISVNDNNFEVNFGDEISIAPSCSVAVDVVFTPQQRGGHEGRIRIESNDEQNPEVFVEVFGQAIERLGIVEPEILDFGHVDVDSAAYLPVTLRNAGDVDLTLFQIWIEGDAFFSEQVRNIVLQPGDDCEIPIGFRPTRYIEYEGSLEIFTNDFINRVFTVELRGNALDITEQNKSFLRNFEIISIYPNPFNTTMTLTYFLPNSSGVSLLLIDQNGRIISTLADRRLKPGVHKKVFDARYLSSGLYFVRLEASGRVFSRKALLIK